MPSRSDPTPQPSATVPVNYFEWRDQMDDEAVPPERSTSAKKIAANRRNAQLSTGPRTQAGKDRVRWNALRHGLTAKHLTLSGFESRWTILEEMRRLVEEFQP